MRFFLPEIPPRRSRPRRRSRSVRFSSRVFSCRQSFFLNHDRFNYEIPPSPTFSLQAFRGNNDAQKRKKKERNENYRESGARYAFLLINLSRTDVTEAACLTEFTRKEEDNANEPLISISRKLEERSVVQHAWPRLIFLNYHRSIMQHCDSPIFEWNFSTIRVGVSRCKDIRLFSSLLLVYTYGKCVSTWPRYGLSRDYFREKQSVGTRTRLDN